MKKMKTILCLGLLSVPFWAPAAPGAAITKPDSIIVGQFTNVLSHSKLTEGVRVRLLKAAVFQRIHAEATVQDKDRTITLQVHRVNERLSPENQRLIARLFVGRGITRHAALNSEAVQKALAPFRYPTLILDEVDDRLVPTVGAQVAGLGQHTRFSYGKGYVAAVCELPTRGIDLNVVKLIRHKQLKEIYLQQLWRFEKNAMDRQKHSLALDYLAEFEKHGQPTRQSAVDSHVCHLHLGNLANMETSALRILDGFAAGLSREECVGLHQQSAAAKHKLLAALWSAEARCRKAPIKTTKPVAALPQTNPVRETKPINKRTR